MSSSPNLAQRTFRFRSDTGVVDGTPTWLAAQGTNISIGVETAFRLRIAFHNTGSAASTTPTVLRVSKNAGAYTAVTTTSGATLGAQSESTASTGADELGLGVIQLGAGSGSAVAGVYDETGSTPLTLGAGNYTEIEFGLILKTAGTANGNTFDFRLYNNTTAFTTYTLTPRVTATVVDTVDDCLANDVLSASSVTKPAIKQEHARLANDVVSASSVSTPAMVQRRDLLANDVISASTVSQPNAAIFAQTALLANDVVSGSSVTQPAAQQRQGLLANDVKSNSSVSQPAVKALHGLLANDVTSASSVSVPAAHQGHGVLANDVLSASSVSQPNAAEIVPEAGVDNLLANDVLSASSVTHTALHQAQVLDAIDVASASSITTPALTEIAGSVEQALFADNVVSASFVLEPLAGEIPAGAILTRNVVSASFVSTPTLVVEGEIIPVPPELGGGGKIYGRGYSRRRYEELLRELEAERREALQHAETFKGKKGQKRALTAARAASEAIRRAEEAADEAAVIAHAGSIARTLEAATAAKSLVEYVERMKKAREEAVEMELDDDDEAILMLVA